MAGMKLLRLQLPNPYNCAYLQNVWQRTTLM